VNKYKSLFSRAVEQAERTEYYVRDNHDYGIYSPAWSFIEFTDTYDKDELLNHIDNYANECNNNFKIYTGYDQYESDET
jgi:hypothetical protein